MCQSAIWSFLSSSISNTTLSVFWCSKWASFYKHECGWSSTCFSLCEKLYGGVKSDGPLLFRLRSADGAPLVEILLKSLWSHEKWRASENKLRDPLKKIEPADSDFTGNRSVIARLLLQKGDGCLIFHIVAGYWFILSHCLICNHHFSRAPTSERKYFP